MAANTASTTSGTVIVHGDSCGWTSWCSPSSTATAAVAGRTASASTAASASLWASCVDGTGSFQRASPKKTRKTSTAHVEGGEQGGEQADEVERDVLVQRVGEDLVLRPEARERRHAGDGEPADDEGARGDRHELAERAHAAHVLLVVHAVDDRAGAEEQQGLEEGVGDHVEDGDPVATDADGQEHVAELADRRVGQHLLDVGLGHGDGGREQRGDHADPGDERGQPRRGGVQHRVDAHHQVDAGGDHGGGVDERRHRRGPAMASGSHR